MCVCVCVRACMRARVCVCGEEGGMYEFLFEGVNAFKRIQMGDRDDDGAALYRVALGRVCVSLNVCCFRLPCVVVLLSTSV